MNVLPPLSLRNRFLLLVLLGVMLPLGVVGLWLSRSALQSGETLVLERLTVSLLELVNDVGFRWAEHRSDLLDLAEHPAVVAALQEGSQSEDGVDGVDVERLQSAWDDAGEIVVTAVVVDVRGRAVARWERAGSRGDVVSARRDVGTLSYSVPIRERGTSQPLGSLEARIPVDILLPAGALVTGVGGSMLALFDERTGVPLAPVPIDPELFSLPRFDWGGEEWISVDRRLTDPPLRVALAGPVGPVIGPFTQAARRGTLALIVVVLIAFVLATLFTRRFTRSLLRLAEAADAVSGGDLSREAEEVGPPEIRDLARAFNTMTDNLRSVLQELTKREAVAAVGEFAASLAHEVRNPLTAVRMDLQLTRHGVADQPETRELVDHAIAEIDRLNESVSGFLRVARSGWTEPEPLDLRTPIDAAIRAARPRFDAISARLDYARPDRPVRVMADGGAVEQLVLNLLLNAADSLGDRGRAGIEIHETGEGVEVTIWDEGCGIPATDAARIFEPFYTTKEAGTGLGLAVAQRIAHAHGTELRVSSEPGEGATFSFRLTTRGVRGVAATDTESREVP